MQITTGRNPINCEHKQKTIQIANGSIQLPDFPGIDMAIGMETTQNNPDFFRRLLTKYRDSQHDFKQKFRTAREEKDLENATRLAHSLKGVSGNLGVVGVQDAAASLEQACKNKTDNIDEALKKVLIELHPVIAGLENIEDYQTENISQTTPEIDKAAITPMLHELNQLLANCNIKSIDILQELEPFFKASIHAEQLLNISNAIKDYDFDKALSKLKILAEKNGIDLINDQAID